MLQTFLWFVRTNSARRLPRPFSLDEYVFAGSGIFNILEHDNPVYQIAMVRRPLATIYDRGWSHDYRWLTTTGSQGLRPFESSGPAGNKRESRRSRKAASPGSPALILFSRRFSLTRSEPGPLPQYLPFPPLHQQSLHEPRSFSLPAFDRLTLARKLLPQAESASR